MGCNPPPTLLVDKLTAGIFNEATAVPAAPGGATTLTKSGQAKPSRRQSTFYGITYSPVAGNDKMHRQANFDNREPNLGNQ